MQKTVLKERVTRGRVVIQLEVFSKADAFHSRWHCNFCGKHWESASHLDADAAKAQSQVSLYAHAALHAPKKVNCD